MMAEHSIKILASEEKATTTTTTTIEHTKDYRLCFSLPTEQASSATLRLLSGQGKKPDLYYRQKSVVSPEDKR